ncbi:hypothetical protein Emed_000250 [Eimeria media]
MMAPWFFIALAAFSNYVVEAALDAAVSTGVLVEASPKDELDGPLHITLGPEAKKKYSKLLPVVLMLAVTASLALGYAAFHVKKGGGDTEESEKSEASQLGTTQTV